jgi:hypothetical protein
MTTLTLNSVLALALSLASQTAVPCGGKIFTGFDTRLSVEIVGRVPPSSTDRLVGLESDGQQVFVATEHRLMMLQAGKPAAAANLPEPLVGIAVDEHGNLFLQFAHSVRVVPRLKGAAAQTISVENGLGPLRGSATNGFLEVTRTPDRARLSIRRTTDLAAFPIADVAGGLGPVSWTPAGLAAVVDNSIVRLSRRDERLTVLDEDTGFAHAGDIALLPDGRAVVALAHVLLLTDGRSRLVIAGADAAVRASGTAVIVFDKNSGFVWRVTGLDRVGVPALDLRHAEELLKQWRQSGDDRVGLEAARIAGCAALTTQAR